MRSTDECTLCGDACGEESLTRRLCPVCFEGIYERDTEEEK